MTDLAKVYLDRIIINVSGTRFEIGKSSILAHPNSRLGKMVSSNTDSKNEEHYFERSITAFESILSFYQTQQLHMPPNLCPKAFKDELEFWQIDYENLDECCLFSFIQFMDKYATRTEFQNVHTTFKEETGIGCLPIRNRIWRIIEYEERTLISKCYLLFAMSLVISSVGTLALGSLPIFRRSLTSCEWFDYMSFSEKQIPDPKGYLRDHDCDDLQNDLNDQPYLYYMFPDLYDDESGNDSHSNSTNKSDVEKIREELRTRFPGITVKFDIFYKLDYFFTAFFTVEQILRWLFCPDLKIYYKSFLNTIDTVILIGTYVEISFLKIKTGHKFSGFLMDCFEFIRLIRVVRLLRYCQNMAVVRVLKFSIKKNAKDLLMLFFHISMIVLVFANLIYVFEERENIDSIPQGWWLGVITITTVGFGDLFPNSVAGKIACSACALCGILTLALVTSIFVETFMSLYGVAQIATTSKEKRDTKWNKCCTKKCICKGKDISTTKL